jgi:predicted ATPase/DNA-binding winged helix-turn-helix (wHTH) protein
LDTSPLIYQFGEFILDTAKGGLFKAGVTVKLRPKVYEALKYLLEHSGRLISKEELMQALWPDAFVTDDSLVQCTLELRRALGDKGQQLLKTVPRRGYVFNGSVTQHPPTLEDHSATEVFDLTAARERPPVKSPRRPHDLPVPRTSLIGREQEVAEAARLLLQPDVRLLSLTGPGGAGKTRLAIAIAGELTDHFAAGVQFVGLASITQPDLVTTAMADALDIQRIGNRTIAQLIGEHLKNAGPFLLVLDNFEQVLSAAAMVAETLDACASLKILVTSRSSLRIYGEQEFSVTPLPQNSAIELFAQRAAAVWPDFAITAENAPAVREICSRLDGLPLAIELAAARTKVLSPRAILDRLQNPLQLLTGGPLDLPERQQTLRNAIDWSYGLLNDAEQRLFRRLSVFVGGCTFEAAEAVCNTGLDLGVDLFDGLSSLVDKSLVQRMDRAQTEPRFAMLETIREYALERLTGTGEQSAVRRAHAAYSLVLAEEGNPELSSDERTQWLTQCDAEIDNFRSALDWLFQTLDLDWSFRLCSALFRFWDMREHLTEGQARLETVLRLAGTDRHRERARAWLFLGAITSSQGDYTSAERALSEGLSIYEELEDDSGIATSLNALGVSARDRGDYALAQSNFERSLACWRMLSDRLAIARCLHNLASVVQIRGDHSRARWALGEAAEIFKELGDHSGAAWSINQQGDIAREAGDIPTARRFYQRALGTFREAGDPWGSARSLTDLGYIDCELGNHQAGRAAFREALKTFTGLAYRRGVARVLEGYACLAIAEDHAARALTLAAAAAHLRRMIGAPLTRAEQSILDRTLLAAWNSLSQTKGQEAWAKGYDMTTEEAVRYSYEEWSGVSSVSPGQSSGEPQTHDQPEFPRAGRGPE